MIENRCPSLQKKLLLFYKTVEKDVIDDAKIWK